MQNNVKSSSVAGVLGVFLGSFGGHDWYLGNTKRAITHVCLFIGGIIVLMVGLILMNLFRDIPALNALAICVLVFSYIIVIGNLLWGFIEGVIILAQGDPGLAAKGYQVAAITETQGILPNLPVNNTTPEVAAQASTQSSEQTTAQPIDPVVAQPEVQGATQPVAQPAITPDNSGINTQAAAQLTNENNTVVENTNIATDGAAAQNVNSEVASPEITPAAPAIANNTAVNSAPISEPTAASTEPASANVEPSANVAEAPVANSDEVNAAPINTTSAAVTPDATAAPAQDSAMANSAPTANS